MALDYETFTALTCMGGGGGGKPKSRSKPPKSRPPKSKPKPKQEPNVPKIREHIEPLGPLWLPPEHPHPLGPH
jgi:hypothetical protein